MKGLLKKGLTGNELKVIAMAAMAVDHAGLVLIENEVLYGVFRLIGRIAFPIFCFLLVEGYAHTRSAGRYAGRLTLFAFISEVPFDLMVYGTYFAPQSQNVFFTLLAGLGVLCGIERWGRSRVSILAVIAAGSLFSLIIRSDYSVIGVLFIALLYLFRENSVKQAVFGAVYQIAVYMNAFGIASALAFIPIRLYNGKRGRAGYGRLFYLFYPAHMMILVLIRRFYDI